MYHNSVTIVTHLQCIIIFALSNQLSLKEMQTFLKPLCFTCVFYHFSVSDFFVFMQIFIFRSFCKIFLSLLTLKNLV